jgi:chaperonin GroEL
VNAGIEARQPTLRNKRRTVRQYLLLATCSVTWRSSAREEVTAEGDERTGIQVLKHALEAPARQIAENSSTDGGVVVARMLEGKSNYGFDAARKRYVYLVEAGIIDPTKVVRVALENAVSVASVLLLSEATMTEVEDEKRPAPEERELSPL